ncbi:hypothetical protein Chor_002379 [Crotalus horridus]
MYIFRRYRGLILVLTFLCYTTFHLSRKPISIVKSELHYNCSSLGSRPNNASNSTTWCDWKPFDQDNYKELFGALDNAFLVAYAIGMYISSKSESLSCSQVGFSASDFLCATTSPEACCSVAYLLPYLDWATTGISTSYGTSYWYRRGLIMGIWNSHTSVGNILGSLIAGIWVSTAWGLSFIVPGIIIALMGVICFLFLIEYPEDVDCSPPLHHGVIEFSFCLLFAKLVSYTFLYWLPLYIVNVARLSAKEAGDMSTLFDVGGIIGGIMAGLISDYTGGRATTCCAMLILAAPMVVELTCSFLFSFYLVMLIICGALVNGPYALITTAVSADLGTHESLQGNAKALSTVTAIIDGTGSVGAALGPLLAGLISSSGWDNVFYMLISADILACLTYKIHGKSNFEYVFCFQLLSRVVFKEIRGWCGFYRRKRG